MLVSPTPFLEKLLKLSLQEKYQLRTLTLSINCAYYGCSGERNLHKLSSLSHTHLWAHQSKRPQPFPPTNRDLSQGAPVTQPFDPRDSIAANPIAVHSRRSSTLKPNDAANSDFSFSSQQDRKPRKPRKPLTAGRWSLSSLRLAGSLNTDSASLMEDIHLQWLY